jgi:hypothetical protein
MWDYGGQSGAGTGFSDIKTAPTFFGAISPSSGCALLVQFPDINKLCNVASCWIYIGILLGAHPILHISRIRVKA